MNKSKLIITLTGLLVANSSFAMWTEDKHGNTINVKPSKLAKAEVIQPKAKFKKTKIVKIQAAGVMKISFKSIDLNGKAVTGQSEKDVACLAYSIFREAGTLKEPDQIAVGQVHVNRLREGNWGNRMCQVVYANKQFSWTSEKMVSWSFKQRDKFMSEARGLMNGLRVRPLESENILHYHATYVNPKWSKQGQVVAMAGPHIFYKNVPF